MTSAPLFRDRYWIFKNTTAGITMKPPLRNFWPDFLSGVLLFPKKIRRFAAGFCCFQKFSPPAAGIYCCPKIHIFVAGFHCFCLEKAQNFPAASRRGLVIQKISAASRRGFVVPKKISAASRRGLVISKFLRKVGSGDIKWGGFIVIFLV